jgi:hypothetical protein
VLYFIAISIADLTVMLMWLVSGGEGVSLAIIHSNSVQLLSTRLGHHESTNNICGGDTSRLVLPLDPKPSRGLSPAIDYHDNTRRLSSPN